jgi:hypothetical protein
MISVFSKSLAFTILLVLFLPAMLLASSDDSTLHTFAPIYDYRASDSVDYASLHLLGPIAKYESKADEYDVALRPLFYHSAATDRDASLTDVIFPVFQYKKDENIRTFSILRIINFERTRGQNADSSFTFFPIVFYRKAEGRPTSLSVFPFGGKMYNRLGRDEISYALWPLYISTKKRSTRVDNYLWPFFASISGDSPDERGYKFWPLFGRAESPGEYRKFFLLWPFWFNYDEDLNTDNPVSKRYFFPFYLHYESPKMSKRVVLWPFFSYQDDRNKGYEEWNFPWPLWQRARGDYKHGWKFLPFASDMTRNDVRTRWYIWPLAKHEVQHYENLDRRRFRVLFFLYRDLKEMYIEPEQERHRRILFWPLFGYEKKKGVSRFYTLALLEPIAPDSEGVERNWSPLWRIYQKKWDTSGNSVTSILWNLYWSEFRQDASAWELFPLFRWHREPETKKWSFLKGLVGYERDKDGRHLKLLWLPWGISLGGQTQPATAE